MEPLLTDTFFNGYFLLSTPKGYRCREVQLLYLAAGPSHSKEILIAHFNFKEAQSMAIWTSNQTFLGSIFSPPPIKIVYRSHSLVVQSFIYPLSLHRWFKYHITILLMYCNWPLLMLQPLVCLNRCILLPLKIFLGNLEWLVQKHQNLMSWEQGFPFSEPGKKKEKFQLITGTY